MNITIENSSVVDIPEIFKLYAQATALQNKVGCVPWPVFDIDQIIREIEEQRQWKILIEGNIACIWAICFSDPFIWEKRNEDPALYIHRIATDPCYRGNNLVAVIVNWAKGYAAENGKKFIRLDTVGKNEKLIEHYTACGFDYLGLSILTNSSKLPAHYHNAAVSLFEIRINS